jgi:hypothetical protein
VIELKSTTHTVTDRNHDNIDIKLSRHVQVRIRDKYRRFSKHNGTYSYWILCNISPEELNKFSVCCRSFQTQNSHYTESLSKSHAVSIAQKACVRRTFRPPRGLGVYIRSLCLYVRCFPNYQHCVFTSVVFLLTRL